MKRSKKALDDSEPMTTPVSEEQHEEILRLIEASHQREEGPCLVCEYLRSQGLPAHGSQAA